MCVCYIYIYIFGYLHCVWSDTNSRTVSQERCISCHWAAWLGWRAFFRWLTSAFVHYNRLCSYLVNRHCEITP